MKKLAGLIILLLLLFRYFCADIGLFFKQNGAEAVAIGVWKAGAYFFDESSIEKLGLAYWQGDGVETDYSKAKALLENLELGGDQRFAYYALADIYESEGASKKSLHYFQLLCRDDMNMACLRAGKLYLDGKETSVDLDKAREYFLHALDRGDVIANYFLAQSYFLDTTNSENLDMGRKYLANCVDDCKRFMEKVNALAPE